MEEGLVVALDVDRTAPNAVLETDEAYLDVVVRAARPHAITLMNLSRDFLERGVRAKKLASLWRTTLDTIDWPCTVIADADDALVSWAVRDFPDVVWVAGEDTFTSDAALCRRCLVRLDRSAAPDWRCPSCGMARMDPDWWWQDGVAVGPHGPTPIPSALPGHAAQVNALFALASAVAMGVTPSAAATAIARVENVDGRYLPHSVGDHDVRVLLAKNPASWTESITTLLEGKQDNAARSIVLAMSARGGGGGQDTAMLWDAPFERLAGTTITVAGSRRDELALRLAVAGVDVQRGDDDVMEAVRSRPAGPVDVVANWPAFNAVLDHTGRG
jgi:UDP-N-acetylmuramyl tripeptide synthase